VIRHGDAFAACSIGGVGIYPCAGGRDKDAGQRLHAALEKLPPAKIPIRALHVGDPAPDDAAKVWYQAQGFWLEREIAGTA